MGLSYRSELRVCTSVNGLSQNSLVWQIMVGDNLRWRFRWAAL